MKLLKLKDWRENYSRLAGESLDSPARAASAAALGVFFGITPFWGFQLALALLAASALKLNRLIAGAASNVSFPPLIPFIVYASAELGAMVTGRPVSYAGLFGPGGLRAAAALAPQYFLGGMLLACICALAAWGLVYALAAFLLRRKELGKENG